MNLSSLGCCELEIVDTNDEKFTVVRIKNLEPAKQQINEFYDRF